jgi:CheY-like chemotaxis protein
MSGLQTAREMLPAPAAPDPALPHALVADADTESRLRRARQLQTRGYRVSVARTAFEAIVKASCHVPDLILVDDSLGSSDVADTIALLSTCPATSHIPIVRLTPGRRLPSRVRAPSKG